MWDRFQLVYCAACATYLDKVYGGAAQREMQRKKMELLAVVHIKGQHESMQWGFHTENQQARAAQNEERFCGRGTEPYPAVFLTGVGSTSGRLKSYLHFILCSSEANFGRAPQWPFSGTQVTQEKNNEGEKGWQNWVVGDSKFHIKQLWPQIMLSIWGIGTLGQRQQVQKHWNEMKTLHLPNTGLALKRY